MSKPGLTLPRPVVVHPVENNAMGPAIVSRITIRIVHGGSVLILLAEAVPDTANRVN